MAKNQDKKVTLTFKNLTPQQAETLARWYERQGEQQACDWFDVHGVETPFTDVGRKGGYLEKDKEGNVIVYCK